MKLKRLLAVTHKEFLHLLRDWRSMGVGIAIPVFLLFMFGYALSLDVNHVPLAVWDQSMTPQSRDLIGRFIGSRYFSVAGVFDNYRDVAKALDSRDAMMALVIPIGFAEKVQAGETAQVQVLVDGSDASTATIALGYASGIVAEYSGAVQLRKLSRFGSQVSIGSADLRPAVWFNPDLESKNFLVPGLIVMIMMAIGTLLTSLTVAREWENGTMEQLISSPVASSEIVIGKFIPYFCLGMFDMALCVAAGILVFGIRFQGSILLLFFLSALFLIGTLGIGMLVSIATKKQLMANQIGAIVSLLPSFLLSGFVFPISSMPKILQAVTYLVPARYFIIIVRGIYLKGVGIGTIWLESLLMTVYAASTIIASLLAFKRRME